MFLSLLEEEEVAAFLGLAHMLATADGTLHVKEKGLLAAVATEVGSAPTAVEVTDLDDVDGVVSGLDLSQTAKNVLLLELAGVALADGELSDAEQRGLKPSRTRWGRARTAWPTVFP